ncbi:DNRLRE domain-containing protein [Streptosporangium sp. NPDC006930]|uniref:DNRLRE domain-containing protein n=1 Tax=Streptosporangium sp. NPDC006930 TaxID=3154783 RepID=UPI00342AD978
MAQQEAKRQNKQVEIETLHTENSTTVTTGDGKTLGTYVYSRPVRVKRDGIWKKIDTTLIVENGVVRPRMVKLDISLSDGGDTDLLTARGETLGTEKDKAGEVKISAPGQLPTPKLSGNRAVYESVYGRGVDLVVTVTETGFHQEIVIRERPAGQLKLPVSVDLPAGMEYGKTSAGKAAVLAGDKPVADLASVRMLDATAAEAPGSGRMGAATASVQDKPGGPVVVLSPDAGFLADPQVAYPVTLAAADSEWYGAGYPDDTFINNKTWGTGGPNQHMFKLLVGNGGNAVSNGPTNDPSTVWRSYLRFDLTGAPFMGRPILNADLRPWNYRSHACGDEKGDIVVRRITSNWSINSLSWSNQPTVTTSGQGTKGSAVGDHCSGNLTSRDVYYTIEDIVRDWAAGQPNYGLRVGALQEGGVINWREFRSANYTDFDGHPPYLYVKYEEPTPEPEIKGIFMPYKENPTVGDALDDTFTSETMPVAPLVTEEQSQAERENADAYFMEDSSVGFNVPDDMTREEWLDSIGAVHTPEPDPSPSPTGPDTAPPTILGTSPEGDDVDVAINTQVRTSFDEPVTGAQVTVKDSVGAPVPGTSKMEISSTVLAFTPAQPLALNTRYTAEVSGAKDIAGNTMPTPHTWSFTTGQEPEPTPTPTPTDPPVEHTISLPVQTDTWVDDEGSTGPGGPTLWVGAYQGIIERTYLKFDTSSLTGKTITNAKLELWNTDVYGCGSGNSGIKAQRVTTAWNANTLTWANQPAAVSDGEVIATDPGGCVGEQPDGVTWTWQVTGAVRAWASGQNNHGLLLRGVDESSSAPLYDRGYQSAETEDEDAHPPVLKVTYTDGTGPGATPTPTPTSGPDRTAPTVIEVSPADGDEDVPANTPIKVTFSEPVAEAQITLTDLIWEEEVTGSAVASSGNTVLTFTPSAPLSWSYYEAEVSGAKDAAGNTMAVPYTWGFIAADSTPTPTPTAPACTYQTWSASKFYSQGTRVTWKGHSWEAISSWPSGKEPGSSGSSGDWRDLGACSGAPSGASTSARTESRPAVTKRDVRPAIGELWTRPFTTKDGSAVTSTTTPHLMAKASDPLRRRSTMEVELVHDPKVPSQGRGLIWSGAVTNVFSGSTGTLQVPKGKLKAGWKVRWRARVTAEGSSGTWSTWQDIGVETAEPTRSRLLVTPLARASTDTSLQNQAAAAQKFPYEHVDWDDCESMVKEPNRPGMQGQLNRQAFQYKNSFSMCYAMWIGERDEDDEVDRSTPLLSSVKWSARLTMLVHTYVGKAKKNTQARDMPAGVNSRQFKIFTRVDQVELIDSDWSDRLVRIGFGEKGRSCTSSFKQGGVARDGKNGREATIAQWRDGGIFEMTFNVPWDGLPHDDKMSTCSLNPWIKYTTNPEVMDSYFQLNPRNAKGRNWLQSITCDSADWIKAYSGGCVVDSVRPVFILNANEMKNGKYKVKETATHIYDALYDSSNTDPARGTNKNIPGRFDPKKYGCDASGCLHRTRQETLVNGNRTEAIRACRVVKPGYKKPDSCDEFPFASTHEGAKRPGKNFSARIVALADNCAAGTRLGAWYRRHRIRENTPFWVDIIAFGASLPQSGATGIVATEATPEELEEIDGCTIDGVGDNVAGPIVP